MGYDSVEVVMEVEDEFNIAISNEEASRIQIVDELVDLVYSRLRHANSEPCPSQHGFYAARRVLSACSYVRPGRIRPDTPLGALIPWFERPAALREILQGLTSGEGQWPQLVRPMWVNAFVAVACPAVLVAGLVAGASFHALLFAMLVLTALLLVTVPLKRSFPKGMCRAGDLAKFVGTLDSKMWTRDEVFEKVRAIVSRELGVKESDVTPEANFMKDLGLS